MKPISPPFAQADDWFVITPSDTVEIRKDPGNTEGYPICSLYINDVGTVNISVVSHTGKTQIFSVTGPRELPIIVSQVRATGTTATSIIGTISVYNL